MEYTKIILLNVLLYNYCFSQEVEFYPSASLYKTQKNKVTIKRTSTEKHQYDLVTNLKNNITLRSFGDKTVGSIRTKRKRATDPVFHGHPKTREELWNERFLNTSTAYDQAPSLIALVHNIAMTYLNDCIPIILYDNQIKSKESYLFQNLLKDFPLAYIHGYIDENNKLVDPNIIIPKDECVHFIIFLTDVTRSAKLLGKQSTSKVVLIARSSQWAVQEFLAGSLSRMFVNLLIIGQSFKEDEYQTLEAPYILYTHKLYTDGLGASQPIVLTSWTHGKFTRKVNLFPSKMTEGYAGHRFIVAAADQPPFVFRRIHTDLDGGNPTVIWDGVEIRLLKLLAERNNFSIEIVEPRELHLGSGNAVSDEITSGRADVAVAGMYVTSDRARDMDIAVAHSQDCAAFITLTSTALPRYRAILGPFHWHVWVALTFTYLIGIFPLAFSDKHTLRHLLNDSGEIENMFWYVFGTFTNCFTFVGKNSWSKTTKITTRLLIGWYWIFTIIITSCYTGSIIAFVTLPVFPETVDTVPQLLSGFYRVGTLDHGGWDKWFFNSSDKSTNSLLRKMEFVPNVEAGIRNTTKAFFWSYAFLGSKAELEYIIQANFSTTKSKRAVLHVSNDCFVPFGVTIGFPNNSVYTDKLSKDIARMVQTGILSKIKDEVRWSIQRSSTGTLLPVIQPLILKVTSPEEKGLTLEDTQGMFLLLAAGFLMGTAALISEWMGGITKRCRRKKKDSPTHSSSSGERIIPTPLSNVDSEIKIITTDEDSTLHFYTRPATTKSDDTLTGQVINVTDSGLTVHKHFDVDSWQYRRSSSVDLDLEVKEIFDRDIRRRLTIAGDTADAVESKRNSTASRGMFGAHLRTT